MMADATMHFTLFTGVLLPLERQLERQFPVHDDTVLIVVVGELPVHVEIAVLLAHGVVSELHRVLLGRLDQRPIALRTGGARRRRGGRRARRHAHHADGGDRAEGRFQRWSGHGHRLTLGLRGPAVVRQPAADHDGDEADEEGEHDVHLGVALRDRDGRNARINHVS